MKSVLASSWNMFFPMQNETSVLFDSSASFFYSAADHGLSELISLLVGINPHILQERWLIQGSFPTKLRQNQDFLSWLLKCRKQSPSLVILCKYSILSQLQSYYRSKIDMLPLPKTLKVFLKTVKSEYQFN